MQISSSGEKISGDNREILYSFWESIPRTAFINASKDVLGSHPARGAILRILREGVQEELVTPSRVEKIRRAMSADEIRERLKEAGMKKVSKTGMYFHLKVLEEAGLIKIISKILEGRHKVAYYGRVARHLFISDPEMRLQKYEQLFGTVTKFSKALVPGTKASHFRKIPKEYLRIKTERERVIGEWLADNEHLVIKLGLDLSDLYEAVKVIDSCNPAYLDLIGELYRLLQIS
ncbi:MAG: helix-turn-helix transcriptional regulator [Candidatus Thorarchaeota archaeon]|nr:MAG: helix-turn-helix transcriptional regulator [Candidatus Thorarchaeota archaeon]